MAKQSTALLFRYYIWLAQTIYSSGHISRKEINRKWANSRINTDSTTEIPERTFFNWVHAIEDLFEIIIECDRKDGGYYILNADEMNEGGIRTWLINTFAVNNLINESHQIKSQILFENIPSGQHFLTPIIEAMRDHKRIRLTYKSFRYTEASTFAVSPYCVKVYQQRWYLLALSNGYSKPYIYALDRIEALEVLDTPYELPAGFDAEAYFRPVMGVSGMDGKCEIVRIKVAEWQTPYLRTLPLHPSQQEIKPKNGQEDNDTIFEYFLVPNYEFRQEVFRNMSGIEVLSPAWLREEIRQEAEAIARQYKPSTSSAEAPNANYTK